MTDEELRTQVEQTLVRLNDLLQILNHPMWVLQEKLQIPKPILGIYKIHQGSKGRCLCLYCQEIRKWRDAQ